MPEHADLYVVSYDVANDRRRNRVHRVLTGFGRWVQYSVFECHLTDQQFVMMRSKLMREIKRDDDRVRIYALCRLCAGHVDAVGGTPPGESLVYVL